MTPEEIDKAKETIAKLRLHKEQILKEAKAWKENKEKGIKNKKA